MKINLAKSAGFCSGVKRAITIAMHTAQNSKRVYMLGDIVHNEEVVRQIEKCGIKKIKRLSRGKDRILLIRAHGSRLKTIERARRLGYRIVDATCPMVKEIQKKAKEAQNRGLRVIIIGDKKHDEVLGIMGQLRRKAVIIEKAGKLPLSIRKIKKAAVLVQSTQNLEGVLKIAAQLRKIIPQLEFYNTICRPTRIKQEEIRKLPLENDLVLVIGSKSSANTKRLYEISKSLNPRTYWVNTPAQIKKKWFFRASSAGVTAGASTPESTIKKVIQKLRSICSA